MCYVVRRPDLSVAGTVTAATVFDWHFSLLRRDGETKVFQPIRSARPTRNARQKWLREALRAAMPLTETDVRAMIDDVSPHAFRAGLAGNMAAEGLSWQTIAMWCRWHSMCAVRMHASRPSMQSRRRSRLFRMIARRR